jgi:hypothetical protein
MIRKAISTLVVLLFCLLGAGRCSAAYYASYAYPSGNGVYAYTWTILEYYEFLYASGAGAEASFSGPGGYQYAEDFHRPFYEQGGDGASAFVSFYGSGDGNYAIQTYHYIFSNDFLDWFYAGYSFAHAYIQPPPPMLTPPQIYGISPTQANAGADGYIEIYGANLTVDGVASVSFGQPVYVSDSQINVYYGAGYSAGAHSVTVSTPAGSSNSVTFTFAASVPQILGISPASAPAGTSGTVEIYGQNLTANGSATVSFGQIDYSSGSQVNISYPSTSSPGTQSLSVSTAFGTSNSIDFTLTQPTGITGLSPSTFYTDEFVSFNISGSGLISASVNIIGPGGYNSDPSSFSSYSNIGVNVGYLPTGGYSVSVYVPGPGGSSFQPGGGSGIWYGPLQFQVRARETSTCARPVNFRNTVNGRDEGGGTLYFEYAWESSSGSLSDLQSCTLGERVSYSGGNPFPLPAPFPAISFDNPQIANVPGTAGGFADRHRTPGQFRVPYSEASFTALQDYRWQCSCADNNAWHTFDGYGAVPIVRTVAQSDSGTWYFMITKAGAAAAVSPLP